ncbi:MAG: hypothetical protein R2724_11865 [Bryobacterales bacterium]
MTQSYPITNGPNPDGSVAAFTVEPNPKTGKPYLKGQWISGNFAVPEPVVVANGVVFALLERRRHQAVPHRRRLQPHRASRAPAADS